MHNMWTEITRAQYRRGELRYVSDTRAAEWAQIAPLLPARCRLGRPREHDLRAIVDAILYLLWTGCQWRALPREFPPRSTVQGYFYRWRDNGTWRGSARLWWPAPASRAGVSRFPRLASSIARARPRRKAAARAGWTPASASRDASAISSPTPRALCSPLWCMRPTSRTRMAPYRCCAPCAKASPIWLTSSPTASIAARNCARRSMPAAPGRSRSSSARPGSKASNSCPGDGWSNAPSPGSAAADASPKTSRPPSPAQPPGCCSPICDCCPDASQEDEPNSAILSQTLRRPRRGRLEGRTTEIQPGRPAMPHTIRAIVVDAAAPGRLAIKPVELRDPDRDEVGVKVTAISLNRGETRRAVQQAEPGWRPGWDFAGVVETEAADGSGLKTGTRVVGILPNGAWAERVNCRSHAIAALPDAVSDAQASTLPVAGLTALHALRQGGLLLG